MAKVKTVYFVTWFLHNKTNDGWAYKVENKYATKDAAEKEYHALLGNYIDGSTYDLVAAILNDSDGQIWASNMWTNAKDDPEPNNG